MKRLIASTLVASALVAGCEPRDAEIASYNLSYAADNFQILRRVVFFNGITDTYLLSIEGACSISDQGNQLEVTCKTGPGMYKKHFLGLSDNVSYFVEQVVAEPVSTYHYAVTFKPQAIIPDIDFRGSVKELTTNSADIKEGMPK